MFVRPYWRDPKPYKEFLDPSMSWFTAWEFLRRNPDYQRDLDAFRADWLEKYGDDDPERFEYWTGLAEEGWPLNHPIATENDEFSGFDYIQGTTAKSHFERYTRFKRVERGCIKSPYVLIPADLSMPMKDLEASVLSQVRQLREKGIKQGTVIPRTNRVLAPRVYVQHLRILDAFAVGATVQEIGDVLAPGATNEPDSRQRDKRIKAAYKAALKMQDGGYRVLFDVP